MKDLCWSESPDGVQTHCVTRLNDLTHLGKLEVHRTTNNSEMHLRVKARKQLNKYSENRRNGRSPAVQSLHEPPERQKAGKLGVLSGDGCGSHSSRERLYYCSTGRTGLVLGGQQTHFAGSRPRADKPLLTRGH